MVASNQARYKAKEAKLLKELAGLGQSPSNTLFWNKTEPGNKRPALADQN